MIAVWQERKAAGMPPRRRAASTGASYSNVIAQHHATGNGNGRGAGKSHFSAGHAPLDWGVYGAAAEPVNLGKGDDRAVGDRISAAVAHGFSLEHDLAIFLLYRNAKVAGVSGDLLHHPS